jgi:hypothetical protein
MAIISKSVQHYIERFLQMQMILDELMQREWGDGAENLREGEKMYETAQLNIPAVIQF